MRLLYLLACILLVCIYCNLIQTSFGKKEQPKNCQKIEPDQNTFCKSDFVVRVHVLRQLGKKKKIKYIVKLKHTYKMYWSHPKPVKTGLVITTNNPCGVDLKDDTTYILSGFIDKRVMKIHQNYSIFIEVKDLTTIQRENFDFRYIFNCRCKVNVCQYPPCQKNRNSCNATFLNFNCFNRFSACVDRSGTCQWMDIDTGSAEYDPDCEFKSDLPPFNMKTI